MAGASLRGHPCAVTARVSRKHMPCMQQEVSEAWRSPLWELCDTVVLNVGKEN